MRPTTQPNRTHLAYVLRILNQLYRQWDREHDTSDVTRSRDWLKGVVFGVEQALRSVRDYRKDVDTR
jgi:hypothetical protein